MSGTPRLIRPMRTGETRGTGCVLSLELPLVCWYGHIRDCRSFRRRIHTSDLAWPASKNIRPNEFAAHSETPTPPWAVQTTLVYFHTCDLRWHTELATNGTENMTTFDDAAFNANTASVCVHQAQQCCSWTSPNIF